MSIIDDEWMEEVVRELCANADLSGVDPEKLSEALGQALEGAAPQMAKNFADDARSRMHEVLTDHRLELAEFVTRLERRWFEALDLLDVVIGCLSQIGEEQNSRLRADNLGPQKNKVEVMTRMHARGVRVAHEVLCLIRGGFADGALSRWRSLHELSACQLFILEQGDSTARKFLDYEGIDRYEEAQIYRRHATTLGYDDIPDTEWESIAEQRDGLVARYGRPFGRRYGWTMDALSRGERSFKGIEEAIGLAHLRPFYAMASRSIHSSPKGLLWDMGLLDRGAMPELLLIGPSNYGFADPGQNCAISLLQLTTAVMLLSPTVTGMAAVKGVEMLIEDMCMKFVEIQQEIEAAEEGALEGYDSDCPE